jgi:hypothetical protein
MIKIAKALVLVALCWAFLPVIEHALNCVGHFFFQVVDILHMIPEIV